ncbi:40S ribosomal protein S13 [Artemisia annua]|uniref:40S ribosomal protein S13 n=1 Tax=Artemisia annua TaxID=35608 RepID=A0A2U1MME6_ARTAN|nr:40S ribosomal protein S13 [Artemisia annua]
MGRSKGASSYNVEREIRKLAKLRLAEENSVTGSKTVEEHGPAYEIPGSLYLFIQRALALRKHLKTNKNDEDAKFNLRCVEGKIPIIASYHKSVHELPADWKYNPDTTSNLVARECPTPDESRPISEEKKTEKGPRNYANIYNVPLDTADQKTWKKFRELDEAVPALTEIVYPNDEEQKTSVKDDHIIVRFIGEFAVDAFNKSCQKYVNKDRVKTLSQAKFRRCKYHKMTTAYHFYLTIVAIEQGKLGVYETIVECNPHDGARTLEKFVLTDLATNKKAVAANRRAKAIPGSTYETGEDGSPDLKDYNTSGMVRRETKGGYDYHNPFGFERIW